jgi:gliding motility-associated-like protein
MKKYIFLIVLLFGITHKVLSQNINVGQGAYLRLSSGTQMSVSGMNIGIEGELICDAASIISIGSKDYEAALASTHPLRLATLGISGNTAITAADIDIASDIAMNTGILNLGAASVRLHGNIVNENEAGYITGGRIVKTLPIQAGTWINTGMGVSFASSTDHDSLPVTRLHERQHFRTEQSIAKFYEFEMPISLTDIDFAYLNAFADKPTDTYLLYYQGLSQVWESMDAQTNANAKRVSAKLPEPVGMQRIALFPFPELNFTKLLTPNSDGINDYFVVSGIEKYPDSKLIVLMPDGKIIYEKTEYDNYFNGDGLSNGTYYFMFFGSKKDSKPLKRGFFELVRQ